MLKTFWSRRVEQKSSQSFYIHQVLSALQGEGGTDFPRPEGERLVTLLMNTLLLLAFWCLKSPLSDFSVLDNPTNFHSGGSREGLALYSKCLILFSSAVKIFPCGVCDEPDFNQTMHPTRWSIGPGSEDDKIALCRQLGWAFHTRNSSNSWLQKPRDLSIPFSSGIWYFNSWT